MSTILDIYREYGVHYVTEGDRHSRIGWANTACPFCFGKAGLHLGVHLEKVWFNCWRCGPHRAVESLTALCHVSQSEAVRLWHTIAPFRDALKRDATVQERVSIHGYKRPSGITQLLPQHERYLESRNFDPDEIASMWGVQATGPVSSLDDIDYRHRLFVPIEWEGREVSFQTRDFTEKSEYKYKACPVAREVAHHKHILYGHARCFASRSGICVEGVTDVWRLGDSAFAVFGIKYTDEQVAQIARRFDWVTIVFDGGETPAYRQARRLNWRLRLSGVESQIIEISQGDPGSMPRDDARALVREARKFAHRAF